MKLRPIENNIENVHRWLTANKLSLNMKKTEFMIIGSRHRLTAIKNSPVLTLGGNNIKRVFQKRSVPMILDDQLKWDKHNEEHCKIISNNIALLKSARSFVSRDSMIKLYNRELKQATFFSTRTAAGRKLHRYRWRMMASAVLVWNQQRQSVNFHVHDFKRERLTPSFAIYNDATYFRLPSVLTKTSLA